MQFHQADSSLSQAEKEDQQITRLINKKPAPSRKKAPRRGPKFDNRRRRIQIDDPDLSKKDRDMSMNHKDIGSTADIALRVMFAYDSAASNETFHTESMSSKTATYHGVLKQGHPSGPTNTGYKSVDRRYFSKKHYDSIVSSAKELLKEDWLNFGWDGGVDDARFRAALDIAISTSDDALYQSKIDTETYNMLLTTLIGVDVDTFSDTFLGGKTREAVNKQHLKEDMNRSAVAMGNQELVNIIRIASELRHKSPKASFEILRNVAAIRKAQQDQQQDDQQQQIGQQQDQGQQQQSQQDQQQQQQSQQDQQGQQQQCLSQQQDQQQQGQQQQGQQQQSQQDQQGAADAGTIKAQLKDLQDAHDGKEAKEIIEELAKAAHISSSRIAKSGGMGIIEDMADADVLKLLEDFAPELVKLDKVNDTAALVAGISELLDQMAEKAGKSKAASTRVNLATLVRLAATVPESRAILMPILAAAKKKLNKKKSKKTSQQEKKSQQDQQSKKKAPPPFGGKKAPPFAKGKKAPPKGKGKKASTIINDADCSW